jgi:hypothetical protein
MQPFQRLLLASLAATTAAPFAVHAGESDLNRYAPVSNDQVTSVSQLSDVKPTDWAYQALSNLVDTYGCVAGYPSGTFKGGQAMTRYEAAALLNACLDRVSESTDELKRLLKEYQNELAVLRGRVDGIEARVGKLEANQFSTTTKLQGEATFVLGAVNFGGSQDANSTANGSGYVAPPRPTPATANSAKYAQTNNTNWGALTFNYDLRLNLNTSFTGKDLLYTRLRSGNFTQSVFGGNPYNLLALDRAFAPQGGDNVVNIDRLYYRFPVGKAFTAVVGPRARNTEMLAVAPSFYRAELLDVFTLNGAPATYNKATGSAFGLIWKQNVKKGNPYFAASTSYVAPRGDTSDPNTGGLFNSNSGGSFLSQIGWAGPQFALSAAWRYGQCSDPLSRRGTQFARQTLACDGDGTPGTPSAWNGNSYSNNFALGASWQPLASGLIPSISLGWGISAISHADYNDTNASGVSVASGSFPAYGNNRNITQTQSWQVGLQWSNLFAKGNAAGFSVGQPTFATALTNNRIGNAASPDGPNDGNYALEGWYKFQVSNNISITPAIFYLSRPNGQYTGNGETNNALGGLVQTIFKF